MRATATAHPNIALIKYWGKRDAETNLPAVGSLSVTLEALTTRTTVEFDPGLAQDQLLLNGHEQPAEQGRLESCMNAIRTAAEIDCFASITSQNDFPTGAGLASSASGYAALVTAAAAASGRRGSEAPRNKPSRKATVCKLVNSDCASMILWPRACNSLMVSGLMPASSISWSGNHW